MLSLQVMTCLLAVVVLQLAPLETNAANLPKHMKHGAPLVIEKETGTSKISPAAKYAKDISLKKNDLEKLTTKKSLFKNKLGAKELESDSLHMLRDLKQTMNENKQLQKKVLEKKASHTLKYMKSAVNNEKKDLEKKETRALKYKKSEENSDTKLLVKKTSLAKKYLKSAVKDVAEVERKTRFNVATKRIRFGSSSLFRSSRRLSLYSSSRPTTWSGTSSTSGETVHGWTP